MVSGCISHVSNQAMNHGIDLYIKKEYQAAAREFERAIHLNPTSDYLIDASKYLATTYVKLGMGVSASLSFEYIGPLPLLLLS